MLLNKPLGLINESYLQSLVTDKVPEGKVIEYKQSLPDNSRDAVKEFLADVSSFANAAGGHLIFGIEEDKGVPVRICELQFTDPDAEILRLENMLRDSVEPRIPGLLMQPIETSSGWIIIIRVPRSWIQPHVVNYQKHWRFYSRNSAGKYPLDVSEVRGQFLLSETRAERVRGFRAERLGKIIAGETPAPLTEAPKTILHIVPFGAFDPYFKADMSALEGDAWGFSPMGVSHVDEWRYNLDGLVTHSIVHGISSARSYLQIFRNGCIEAVDVSLISVREGQAPTISSGPYEHALVEALSRFLSIQKRIGVETPLFAMVSLLGVSGFVVEPAASRRDLFWRDHARPIDRNDLVLSEVMIDSFEIDHAQVLKPVFDAIWNASGWPRSLNYNNTGNWLK